jgi:fumarate reductase subunit C
MRATTTYTPYHPKWYRRPVSTYWWLQRGAYLKFILRELSSVFIAYWVTVTLIQIYALTRGREAYASIEAWRRTPFAIAISLIAFFFVVFHAVTWFNLAPKAMVVHMGKKPVPAAWVVCGNYLAWFVASALVAIMLLWE